MPKRNATSATPKKTAKPAPTLPGLEKPLTRNQQHPDGGQLPDWTTTQLRANKNNAASRTAKYHRCRKCKEIVLSGLTHDSCAWTATVDPTPLNRNTELAAILTNRDTFQAAKDPGNGYILDYRRPGTPFPAKALVLPQHRCKHRFPGFLETPTTLDPNTNNDYGVPDEPAF